MSDEAGAPDNAMDCEQYRNDANRHIEQTTEDEEIAELRRLEDAYFCDEMLSLRDARLIMQRIVCLRQKYGFEEAA